MSFFLEFIYQVVRFSRTEHPDKREVTELGVDRCTVKNFLYLSSEYGEILNNVQRFWPAFLQILLYAGEMIIFNLLLSLKFLLLYY